MLQLSGWSQPVGHAIEIRPCLLLDYVLYLRRSEAWRVGNPSYREPASSKFDGRHNPFLWRPFLFALSIHIECVLHAILTPKPIGKETTVPPLQVKDCPEDVYERLRRCAREENRSIAQQALTIVEDYLNARDKSEATAASRQMRIPSPSVTQHDETDYLARRRKAFERIAALPPLPITKQAPSSVEILAQIRMEEAQ